MSQQRQAIPALSQGYQQRTPQIDNTRIFYSQQNYARLLQPLREHYEKKLGKAELPENIDQKLQTRLQWYMEQVIKGNGVSTPVNSLNQDVYRETMLNMDAWFQKQTSLPNPPIHRNQMVTKDNKMFESIGSRFEKEQQSRAPAPAQPVLNTDFSLPNDDSDSEDPLDKYERLRKERESEAVQIVKPKNAQDQYSEPSAQPAVSMVSAQQQPQNQAQQVPPLLGPRPQEYIIKQEDIVKYRENENNLFINSGDRNWLLNRNENRYKFTINFNPAANTNSNSTYSPSVQNRFKNITRMELVKAIVSGEGLEVAPNITNTARISNLLIFPYVMVHIDEWSSNSYGTNFNIDNCFAMVHYDQVWRPTQQSGTNTSDTAGYISLTPRYLKAQRIYHPTPLGNLQKLTFSIQRPDGTPLSEQQDTLDINTIYFDPYTSFSGSSSTYATSDRSWIYIKSKNYFSQFFAVQGDRIIIQGYNLPSSNNVSQLMAEALNGFINNSNGHLVVGTAYDNGNTVIDGCNTAGYSNYVIIRSRFQDPTTGSVERQYFGGSLSTEIQVVENTNIYSPSTPCALLNKNRQTHFVLRLITREMDSTSNIRPDNS